MVMLLIRRVGAFMVSSQSTSSTRKPSVARCITRAMSHLQTKAQAKFLDNPKAIESTADDTRPKAMTKRLPWRSEARPQNREEIKRPIM